MDFARRIGSMGVLLAAMAAAEGAVSADPPASSPTKPAPDVPFVRRWLLLGPFLNADDGFLARALVPERDVVPTAGARTSKGRVWVEHHARTDWVYPEQTLGDFEWSGFCAFTYLHVPEELQAVLWFGHDDSARLYLDGTLVHEDHTHRPSPGDAFGVPVHLSAGVHRLLFKVEDVEGYSGFSLRIARPDGRPATLRPSLLPSGEDLGATARAQPGFFSLAELLRLLPLDTATRIGFDEPASLDRLPATGSASHGWPYWYGFARVAGRRGPPPGFSGAIAMHPAVGGEVGARFFWKVRLPRTDPTVVVRAAAETGESAGRADTLLRIGVFDGDFRWVAEKAVGGHGPAWESVAASLAGSAGTPVLLVFEVGYTGEPAWEEIHLDEIEVR